MVQWTTLFTIGITMVVQTPSMLLLYNYQLLNINIPQLTYIVPEVGFEPTIHCFYDNLVFRLHIFMLPDKRVVMLLK